MKIKHNWCVFFKYKKEQKRKENHANVFYSEITIINIFQYVVFKNAHVFRAVFAIWNKYEIGDLPLFHVSWVSNLLSELDHPTCHCKATHTDKWLTSKTQLFLPTCENTNLIPGPSLFCVSVKIKIVFRKIKHYQSLYFIVFHYKSVFSNSSHIPFTPGEGRMSKIWHLRGSVWPDLHLSGLAGESTAKAF